MSVDDCSLILRPCDNSLDSDDWERATMMPTARAVIDTNARTTASANVVSGVTPTILFTREGASLNSSMPDNVCQVPISSSASGLDVRQALTKLGEQGANEILVEAGPTLVGSLEQENLIDQWLIYMAPLMVGSDARPTHHAVFKSLGQANRYAISAHDLIGDDLRIIMQHVAKS